MAEVPVSRVKAKSAEALVGATATSPTATRVALRNQECLGDFMGRFLHSKRKRCVFNEFVLLRPDRSAWPVTFMGVLLICLKQQVASWAISLDSWRESH